MPVIIGTSFDQYKQADGTITGVPRWPLIVVRFSRPMAPSAASRASFSLGSGAFGSVSLIEPRVDPVERAVIFSPRGAPLEKNTQYELTIHSGGGANALAAYDGAEFVGQQIIHFTTADSDDVTEPDFDISAKACNAFSILNGSCSGTFCHGGGLLSSTGQTPPAMGLNLATVDGIQGTAVGHAAIEVQDPADPGGVGNPNPGVHFPEGMPIIQPNSSAGSYLMYKILMRPAQGMPAASYVDPTVPDLRDPGAAIAADLRPRMFGEPMPNPSILPEANAAHPNDALQWDDLKVLRAWIDEGAPSCPCPTTYNGTYDCPPPKSDAGVDGGDDTGSDAGTDAGGDTAVDDAGTDGSADADAAD